MASTDARPVPEKNVAYRVTFPILDADGDLVTGATGLDSEISKDGGTFTDCTNEATEIATSSGIYYLDITSTEMNADTVAIIVKTSTSGAKTTPIILYPEEAGDIRVNITQCNGTSVTARDLGAQLDATVSSRMATYTQPTGFLAATFPTTVASTTNITAGTITTVTNLTNAPTAGDFTATMKTSLNAATPASVTGAVGSVTGAVGSIATGGIAATSFATGAITATAIAADAIGASELAADAVTEIQSGLATAASITTLSGFVDTEVAAILAAVDTEVAAILADTNELQTDWANGGRLDVILDSAGAAGDPWATALPGSYTAGQAGKIVGDNINATVSSRATQTSVDAIDDLLDTEIPALTTAVADIPTNAELATALAAADDAVLTAIDALPTNAELATALGTADDAMLAQIASVKSKTDLIPGTQDGLTFAQMQMLMAAVLLGKASGLATTSAVYRAADDSKARITATVDVDGNRTAVTLDAT